MECSNKVSFCKVKCHACDFEGREDECPFHSVDCGGETVPTFAQWKGIYARLSERRNKLTGMLDKAARRNIVASLEAFRKAMNYSEDDKVSVITRKTLQQYCDMLDNKNVTKKAKVEKIMACFARWIRFETEDQWTIPRIEKPEIKDDRERFHEPPPEQLLKIAVWYRGLVGRGNGSRKGKDRLFATLMLHYAMRNGDCVRLKWSNIKIVDGKPRLEYKPHKTRLSSKRIVKVWMNQLDYYDFMEYRRQLAARGYTCGDDDCIMGGGKCMSLQSRLNKELKGLGLDTTKKLYIFRKLCTSAAVREHGSTYAEAISGDDYKTIQLYYSDINSLNTEVPSALCF